jgi:hypothetical protein
MPLRAFIVFGELFWDINLPLLGGDDRIPPTGCSLKGKKCLSEHLDLPKKGGVARNLDGLGAYL